MFSGFSTASARSLSAARIPPSAACRSKNTASPLNSLEASSASASSCVARVSPLSANGLTRCAESMAAPARRRLMADCRTLTGTKPGIKNTVWRAPRSSICASCCTSCRQRKTAAVKSTHSTRPANLSGKDASRSASVFLMSGMATDVGDGARPSATSGAASGTFSKPPPNALQRAAAGRWAASNNHVGLDNGLLVAVPQIRHHFLPQRRTAAVQAHPKLAVQAATPTRLPDRT